jgi:arginine:ornithine antiporter/lysine permease
VPLGAFIALAARLPAGYVPPRFQRLALGVPVWEQVKNTMLITLWVFIGVEGAVVVSARARHKRDVGRATLLAVLSALAVYLLVTLLSLGVVPRSELAEMRNPSMAGLMVKMMGSWGEMVIAAGLIVSVCGAYLSWTIMAAEVPFLAATHKAFRACLPVRTATTPVRLAVADQYQRSGIAGADLADRFGLRHPADHRLRDDSGALSAGRRLSAENRHPPAAQSGGYRRLHLWLMVIMRRDLCICCCRWYFTLRVFWSFCTPAVRTSTIVRSNAANWR